MKEHFYQSRINWTGNTGSGTASYSAYERTHEILIVNKQVIRASSDPSFRGDPVLHNPEELFLSSIASCHMLWYLHLCSAVGLIVIEYDDHAKGIMLEDESGSGRFISVTLSPKVRFSAKSKLKNAKDVIDERQQMSELAVELHSKANQYCFIANSLNFKVDHNPEIAFD